MAEQVHVLGEGGVVSVMDLPLPEAIQDRMTKGYLKRVNADGSPYVETDVVEPSAPSKTAPKDEWIGWAVKNGMSPDDAEALTKADLIEKFGA